MPASPKRPRGRPKGSTNKNKADVTLSPEVQRIRAQGQAVMNLIREKISVAYSDISYSALIEQVCRHALIHP